MSLIAGICQRLLGSSGKIFYLLRQKRNCSFLNSGNCQYLERLYNQWQENPISVPESWAQYFNEFSCEPNRKFSQKISAGGIPISHLSQNRRFSKIIISKKFNSLTKAIFLKQRFKEKLMSRELWTSMRQSGLTK